MGAQSSHHEPLNAGGIPPANDSFGPSIHPSSSNSNGGGLAPDFNRANSFSNSHRMSSHKKKTSLATKALNPRNTIRKSLRKRREKRKNKENMQQNESGGGGSNNCGRKVSYSVGVGLNGKLKEKLVEFVSTRRSTIIAHGINVTRNSSRRCNPLPPPTSAFDEATFNGDTSANNNTDTLQHQFSVRMANNTWSGEFRSPPAGEILPSSTSSSVSSVPASTTTSTTGTRTSISVQIVNGGNSGSGGIGSGGPCSITTSQKPQQEDHLLHEEHDQRNRPYAAGHGVFKSLSIFPAPEPTPCQHHLRHRQEEGEEVPTNLQTRKIRQEHSKLTNTMSAPSKLCSNKVEGPDSSPASRGVAMERLRRSFRDSFRKKKEGGLEASKPHQWQHDEAAVRAATCAFPVKYLGCVEVFESRGMQVCEEALKVLRASRRRPIRGMLHVSGDGLRVVDDETKGLLVDQTIEKVSFCAPDRNHERGFSYICRDGTTRRWMCHGFVAIKETGERLSHAVGCAFAACLDRKQKRDKECGVTMTFDQANNTFTRMGSFKQMSITDRLTDPQVCKPNGNNEVTSPTNKAPNPHAIARPHATPLMLQRQGSCRVFHHLNQSSPFKRQLSLRLNDLPSNMERQRSHSLTSSNIFDNIPDSTDSENGSPNNGGGVDNAGGMTFPSDAYNNNGAAYGTGQGVSSIPEDTGDSVSALCQELWQGLSLLSSDSPSDSLGSYAHPATASLTGTASPFKEAIRPVSPKIGGTILVPSVEPIREELPWSTPSPTSGSQAPVAVTTASGGGVSKAEEWLAQLNAGTASPVNGTTSPNGGMGQRRNPPLSQLRANTMGAANPPLLQQNQPPVWKPTVPAASYSSATPLQHTMPGVGGVGSIPSRVGGRQSTNFSTTLPSLAAQGVVAGVRRDPFDAEWVSLDNGDGGRPQQQPPLTLPAPPMVNPNNPFLPASSVTKAFEVQM